MIIINWKCYNKISILFIYLNADEKNIEYLQSFNQINNFVNYSIENYYNVFSKDEAGNKRINSEIDGDIPIY